MKLSELIIGLNFKPHVFVLVVLDVLSSLPRTHIEDVATHIGVVIELLDLSKFLMIDYRWVSIVATVVMCGNHILLMPKSRLRAEVVGMPVVMIEVHFE